ncbi:MAG: DUF692 domain-containing protein [Gammaproteobacteria bacterium]|jgi:uncharacterized protein (UPF0276 family)|nr:DUF692 domain-containing protein [Gammaproteobacteria bacterium]
MRSTKANTAPFPYLGFGLGLRTDHYQDIIDQQPAIDWFEILTENYLVPGGKPLYYLDKISENYPIVMHGVSMSLGSIDPLDMDYMKQVKNLAKRVDARWISDHLCWTGIHQKNMHDLLPLPYTEEALKHVVSKIKQAQDFLGTQLLIENPSTYLTFSSSTLTEWDFMREMALAADCLILLDINNIYVSAFNHGFDPIDYLKAIPANRVQQMHLAGHTNNGDHIIDTHDHPIIDPVWKLYAQSLEYFERVSTMIERDDHIPALSVLIQELEQAKHIAADVFQVEHAGA